MQTATRLHMDLRYVRALSQKKKKIQLLEVVSRYRDPQLQVTKN